MEIQKLQWDSDFFGFEIFRINIKEEVNNIQGITDTIKATKADLIYIMHDGCDDTVSSNELLSQAPIDIKITYSINLDNFRFSRSKHIDESIQLFSPKDSIGQLYDLAYQSGHKSRFKVDNHFNKDDFERLYRIWVDNSISQKIADYVFVSKKDGDINGFVTLKIINKEANIGLIAVDSKSQGFGVGRKLINKVIDTLLLHSVTKLYVATQKSNEGACKFYSHLGFEIDSITSIYHIWRRDTKAILEAY